MQHARELPGSFGAEALHVNLVRIRPCRPEASQFTSEVHANGSGRHQHLSTLSSTAGPHLITEEPIMRSISAP